MANKTSIEWTEQTWNPIRGCTKISPGCTHCYAEVFAERFRGVPGHPYEQGFDLRLVPEKLDDPVNRHKPTTYFVNSMSDLFHKDVPDEYIGRVWSTMLATPRHTYQVLTKRAERMAEVVTRLHEEGKRKGLREPSNIWLGVSVENRKHGLPRIEHLRRTPAAIRFLSIEPLLEDLGTIDLEGIHWVIVGGESGHGARPMHADWARNIRNQCVAANVPFFFKQHGNWLHESQPQGELLNVNLRFPQHQWNDGTLSFRVKGKGNRFLDGIKWDQVPNVEAV